MRGAHSPNIINARLPRHVCCWLSRVADRYTSGDQSSAFARLCSVGMALESDDIFNVGDAELVRASSADLYCLLGIGGFDGITTRTRSRSSLGN